MTTTPKYSSRVNFSYLRPNSSEVIILGVSSALVKTNGMCVVGVGLASVGKVKYINCYY